MELLHENRFHTLHRCNDTVLFLTRSPETFDTAEEIASAMSALEACLSPFSRPVTRVITDLRQVRGRHDPEFEGIFQDWRRRVYRDWERVIVICKTQVGKLQLERHMSGDAQNWVVFLSEEEAFRCAGILGSLPPDRDQD